MAWPGDLLKIIMQGKKMELHSLPISTLYDLRQQIGVEVTRRESAKKVASAQQIQALMRQHGLREDELSQTAAIKKPVAAKYQNPVDPTQTWSGRGRKPAWVQMYLENGGALEMLALR